MYAYHTGVLNHTGYRLIAQVDSAVMYRNEKACGQAIKNSGIDRSELFYTTKIPPGSMGYDRAKRQIDTSLKEIGFEYIDLFVYPPSVKGNEANKIGSSSIPPTAVKKPDSDPGAH